MGENVEYQSEGVEGGRRTRFVFRRSRSTLGAGGCLGDFSGPCFRAGGDRGGEAWSGVKPSEFAVGQSSDVSARIEA